MPQITIILIFVFAAFLGTALIVMALLTSSKRQDALRKAVTARGWNYDHNVGTGDRPSTITISDAEGGWLMEIKTNSATDGSGRSTRKTTWRSPDGAISDGLAILAPTMSPKEAAKAETMMDRLGDGIGGGILNIMFGDLGPEAGRLQSIDVPGSYGLLMATPEAKDALVSVATHPVVKEAKTTLPRGATPVIRRSSRGLEITVRRALSRPDEVIAIAELGEMLRRELHEKP